MATIIQIMSRGVRIGGAFTRAAALRKARKLAGVGAKPVRRGQFLGYFGGNPEWVYIRDPIEVKP